MKKLDRRGIIDAWLIAFIVTIFLFFGIAGFAFWAFNSRTDYKDNADIKIAAAVQVANQKTSSIDAVHYSELEKQPYHVFTGPADYASVSIAYPKTWSAYVDETSSSQAVIDGYFNPNLVPGLQSGASFAIRLQMLTTPYSQEAPTLTQQVKAGTIKVSPFKPVKVPSVTGIRIDGQVAQGKQGSMIVLPIRSNTLVIWTEAPDYLADFNNIILPNLTFVP